MASALSISGRASIHRESTPGSPNSSRKLAQNDDSQNNDSQQELSDSLDSDDENTTQNSEKLLVEPTIKKGHLKKRIQPKANVNYTLESAYSRDDGQPSSLVNKSNFILILFIIIVPVAVGIYFNASWVSTSDQSPKKVCSFKELQNKYPKEGEYLWHNMKVVNEHILNNRCDKPAVFLFVHHDKQIALKIIKDIAQTSSRCFDSSQIIQNIDFSSKEAIEDYGHVIATYKDTIKEGNVILIANINEIPGEAAKALHAICDTVTPLVKKVIILLSLTAERRNSNEKIIDTAENALRKLWQDKIKPNELDPIITRVTDQVLLLQST
ncbi:uncharacterized protein LOC129911325 [Episyrphus balteatus]|uniref:uncharacterized protein LOC129911325 n=1 Tax=Episyrphus balteatus TaxID=286459 RepID=UPI002486404A|nr:uncharacterized protein LOC129911325 [Episyrphus balteatus]